MSRATRLAMIDRADGRVSLVRQCRLVGISRSSLYYQPKAPGAATLELMRLIDEQYLKTPFYGSRKMAVWLRERGYAVGRYAHAKQFKRMRRELKRLKTYLGRVFRDVCRKIDGHVDLVVHFSQLLGLIERLMAQKPDDTNKLYALHAADCLAKDRETLLAFYDFPAEHWKHIRTGNPIESTFATVRHRTVRAKGCLSCETAKIMVFKMIEAAQKSWRKLDGQNQSPKVIEGIKSIDGIKEHTNHAAA